MTMKSDPPTPTRAPDNQFRQIACESNYIRDTSLLNVWSWGRRPPAPAAIDTYVHT